MYFGTVPLAIVNLYMAVTSGNDWALYYEVIERCGAFYRMAFLFFTFFFVFALFNILTGIFVEKAVLATQPDRDELILEQCRKSRKEADEFRVLCNRLDTDHSGTISYDEFVLSMQDDRMVAYMASVGLEVHDVELFFKIVANGSDEEVDIGQFVEGCMGIRGQATGLAMQKSLYETSRLHTKLQLMNDSLTDRMAEMSHALQQTRALLSKAGRDYKSKDSTPNNLRCASPAGRPQTPKAPSVRGSWA
jgi:hypothetical protein